MERAFVTGGTGFIGSNLVSRLLVDGYEVNLLTRSLCASGDSRIKIINGDILRPESFTSAIGECDVVFHCAGHVAFGKRELSRAWAVNVEGTRNVLEASHRAGTKRFVHISACAVLGYAKKNNSVLDEKSRPLIPESNVYAYTKLKAEDAVGEYVLKGLNASIANPATVYGPGDKKMNSGNLIKKICASKIGFAPPGGTSYVGMGDLIDGIILMSKKGRPGERYIFCSQNLTFKDLVNRIASVCHAAGIEKVLPRWTYLPAVIAMSLKDMLPAHGGNGIDLMTAQIIKESYYFKYFTSQKAIKELGWAPKESLEDAAAKALQFYKKEGLLG